MLTVEQRDFAATVRGLLKVESPVSLARALNEPGADRSTPQVWAALAGAGVFGLAIPEEFGGAGGSLDDLAVFYVEAGRALCPTTVHSTVYAALVIDQLGTRDARSAFLPSLAAGTSRGATALYSARDAAIVSPVLTAESVATRWRLDGIVDYVADADVADVLVVSAATRVGARLFLVDTGAAGLAVEPLPIAGGQRACAVRFDGVEAHALLSPRDSPVDPSALRRLANAAVALMSLDLVGVGQAVLDRTVGYTTLRHQFGRPIASFQAAQHLVADMHIALAAARLAAHAAVCSIARGHTATRETAVARMHAARAARQITLDAHQLHGGMGYVTETDLHLWSERARSGSTFGGGADVAAAWLEETMDDPRSAGE